MKAEDLGNAILRVVNAVGAVVAAILALVLVLKGAESQQPIIITTGGGEAQVIDAQPAEDVVARGSGYNVPCYFEQGGAVLSADSGCSIRIESGASLTTANGSTFSPNNLSAAYVTATTSISTAALSVGGYSQSGAVRAGSATFVVSGTLINHGFGTTPTSIVVTGWALTDTFTNTIGILRSNATSFTVAIPGGATVTQLTWVAIK